MRSTGGGPAASGSRRVWVVAAALVALGLTAAAVTYSLAYRAGQADERKQLQPYLSGGTTPSGGEQAAGAQPSGSGSGSGAGSGAGLGAGSAPGTGTTPPGGTDAGTPSLAGGTGASGNLGSVAGGASGSSPSAGTAGTPATPTIGADPRQPGLNYLELCTLTYRDGLTAVEFLGKNGLRAGLVPAQKAVDPAKAAANNGPHVVFILDGIPSDRFRASEKERAALIKRVEDIGRRFQREQRGASDFSRPAWRLFRERDR